MKISVNTHLDFLSGIINKSFRYGEFPNVLKYAEVFLAYKKKDRFYKGNYRLASLPLHMSKTFERSMYKQIEVFVNSKLSSLLTGFRKNHSTQNTVS